MDAGTAAVAASVIDIITISPFFFLHIYTRHGDERLN
jgi:hypothetical protein